VSITVWNNAHSLVTHPCSSSVLSWALTANTHLTVGLDDYTAKKRKGFLSLSLSCFPVKISKNSDKKNKKAVCTSLSSLLFIVLFIKSHILFLHILLFCTFLYSTAHFTFYFFFTYIYAVVWCYFYIIFILCTVHWADLIWPTFHFWLYPV